MREELGKRQTVGMLNMKGDRWLIPLQQPSKEEAQQGAMVSDSLDHEGDVINFCGVAQGDPASEAARSRQLVRCT